MPALPPIIRTLTSALALLLATSVMAQTPGPTEPDAPPPTERLTYSGLLTDAGGAPLADGDRTLVFRAYATPEAARAGAAPVWEEAHAAAVAGGRFFVVLGSKTPLADDGQWYTVSVDGEAPSAPTRLAPSPGQALAPGNTLQDSYDNGNIINLTNGRPFELRGSPTTVFQGLVVRDLLPVFTNQQLTRFRLRSIGSNQIWEYRVYGSNSSSPVPGTFAISDATGGARGSFRMSPGVGEDLLVLDGTTTSVGSPAEQASFQAYTTPDPANPSASSLSAEITDWNGEGGSINLYEEDGTSYAAIQPLVATGEGGYFRVASSSRIDGFEVRDGSGAGEMAASIKGTNGVFFDTGLTGPSAVQLPMDAIEAAEILDEAGTAHAYNSGPVSLNSGFNLALSRTITAPTSGFVLVMGSGELVATHNNGTSSVLQLSVSNDCDATPTAPVSQQANLQIPSSYATGTFRVPTTVHGLFAVSPGVTTFCTVVLLSGGSGQIDDQNLTLVFLPTAYGATQVNAIPAAGDGPEADGAPSAPLTQADIAAERAASIRDRELSVEAEVQALRARLDAIEREIGNAQRR